MWKESYRIGIEQIDQQHMELFRMAEELMKAIEANADSSAFKKAIDFLKEYVVYHFTAEEAYQASVGYCSLEAHKKLHHAFTDIVLEFETRLIDSDYDIRAVKELAGMLTAWLIYHVADADQKIAKNLELSKISEKQSCILSITAGVVDTLEKMVGFSASDMAQKASAALQINGDIVVDIGFSGDITGHAYFSFSKALAFKLIEVMTFTTPEEVDELVCSALAEISNIASGNATIALAEYGTVCDITTPSVTLNAVKTGMFDEVTIHTEMGELAVCMQTE